METNTQSGAEMPRYKCHKEVWALRIAEIHPGRGDGGGPGATMVPSDVGYAPFSVGEDYLSKHNPKEGGYYVVYSDGYKSFSPAAAFEEGYTRV